MNVMPVAVDGDNARLGGTTIRLPAAPAAGLAGKVELGIRPEFVTVGREGMQATIRKVEDIGRHRIVRAAVEGHEIAAIVPEDGEIPADAHVAFRPEGINLYAASRRVPFSGEREARP